MEQTTAYPQAGMPQPQYGPPDGFAPPAAPAQFAPYNSGQFAQSPYSPEPYSPSPELYSPEPYQPGPYQPGPGHSGSHPVQPAPEQHGGSYGEFRQEIGPDGLVRRVPQDGPGDQQSGPIYSWAPPPPVQQPPMPQPPMYQQPPMGQQPPPHGGQQPYAEQGPPPGQMPYAEQGPNTGQLPYLEQGPPPGWHGGPPNTQQPFQPQHVPHPGQPGHSVNDLNLLKRARKAPRGGWRRAVHKASGGMINPGESAADVVFRDLAERVNQPVRGDYRIAILSLKGGVGKTTTTVGLGSTFSSVRGDRVIAIDANPDLGTLAHRVPRQTRSTVRNLLEDQHITRYSDVRAHTSQAPSRLEVLASEQDPAVSEAFSEADYRQAIGILQSFYNIILTDCGTGLMHSAMAGVLDMASSLVLVTSPAIDGARSASATLDWLDHHGYSKLVERTVVVVNASRRGASTIDLDQLRKLFLDRTRAVQVVPFDDHLAEGAEIDLELVSKPTRRALLELAAMVADDFGYMGSHQYRPGPSRH
ncbi:AAA family ATPase [Nocardia sp. NBC_00565]|uniref:MinD/ParA family ATP-binding protein n=1 Tax=Nocardia sp. NBC_00565 TaxID=2975993 RepID=UPI002E806A11|nr:AAA family ATPase [Nocardia sp. NBC_00565]WUC08164.1 AAA family ATPase [Nocardia sp. NBC_00565]